MTFNIGQYDFENRLILAPMAGVTDLPFRRLCRRLGAGLTPSEMLTANTALWDTRKSRTRLRHDDEAEPRMVQIAGAEPRMLSAAARDSVARGAQIIDINMGCPAKKVCNKLAGSALLRDEELVERILDAVVAAVDVPVTLKIRTGWDKTHRNGVAIARIAERSGICALSVHGRTRACRFGGTAEYDTIRDIRREISIPLIANGDIDDPAKAASVLKFTGADAVMIGRAAQGRPWLFDEIGFFLTHGRKKTALEKDQVRDIMLGHLQNLYRFYGEFTGTSVARKHLSWYLANCPDSKQIRSRIVRVESTKEQMRLLEHYFRYEHGGRAPAETMAV